VLILLHDVLLCILTIAPLLPPLKAAAAAAPRDDEKSISIKVMMMVASTDVDDTGRVFNAPRSIDLLLSSMPPLRL
jgi:hypothetical protein